jgi:hypothetical protein
VSVIVAFHDEASSIFFSGPPAHVEGTNILPEAKHGENWRAALGMPRKGRAKPTGA